MVSEHNKIVIFRMNGISHAFLRELGCRSCPQCSANKPRANTSASLIIKDHKNPRQIEKHILFDFGAGVVDSLIDYGVEQVDYLFNSHNHLDHIADLDRLLMSQKRIRPDNKPTLYSTTKTWEMGIARNFPWLTGMVNWVSINQEVVTRDVIVPGDGLGIHLKITPIPVYHGSWAYEPVIYMLEFGTGDSYKKLILCWDLLHLATRHPLPTSSVLGLETRPGSWGYPTDDYLEEAKGLYSSLENPARILDPDELLPDHRILGGANELFLAGNMIEPHPITGHASLISGLNLIRRTHPERTWIVHYSGHEDYFGSLSDDRLQNWLDSNKKRPDYGLDQAQIFVARHGIEFAYTV